MSILVVLTFYWTSCSSRVYYENILVFCYTLLFMFMAIEAKKNWYVRGCCVGHMASSWIFFIVKNVKLHTVSRRAKNVLVSVVERYDEVIS